jgi:hypothetical protein
MPLSRHTAERHRAATGAPVTRGFSGGAAGDKFCGATEESGVARGGTGRLAGWADGTAAAATAPATATAAAAAPPTAAPAPAKVEVS